MACDLAANQGSAALSRFLLLSAVPADELREQRRSIPWMITAFRCDALGFGWGNTAAPRRRFP